MCGNSLMFPAEINYHILYKTLCSFLAFTNWILQIGESVSGMKDFFLSPKSTLDDGMPF